MKIKKHKSRFVCRKEKKAIKNYPCPKTKWGRYLIEIMDSYYDNGSISVGSFDGCEIMQYDKGYDHPKGWYYEALIYNKTPWTFDEDIYEKNIDETEKIIDDSSIEDETNIFGLYL